MKSVNSSLFTFQKLGKNRTNISAVMPWSSGRIFAARDINSIPGFDKHF